MKKPFVLLSLLGLSFLFCLNGKAQVDWHWDNGTIVVNSPERPAGQQDALNLSLDPIPIVRVAFVGVGSRGSGAVERWTHINGVRIVAICDAERENAERAQNILRKAGLPDAELYVGEEAYKDLCKREDINLVYTATDWLHHVPVTKCALENGKNAVCEVPAAMDLKDCWELINLAETKRLHCMMLENCCYDFFELNTLNMAQAGVFGEILHTEGAYLHDLTDIWDTYWHKWRLDYNSKYRGDIYPTHGLGPVAQLLNIHRGDRMKTLVAMDTKAASGPFRFKKTYGKDIQEADFRNGDHTTTLIRTENGKVIEIQHDVLNHQPYNRRYQLTGTEGFANKYQRSGYALSGERMKQFGVEPKGKVSPHEFMNEENEKALLDKFRSPIVDKYEAEAKVVGGHGGMDFIMDSRLVYCLQNGLPLDMDVYDMAEWCCLAELGALSMDHNCASVQVPDFTRGSWNCQQGYKHCHASAAQEEESAAIAKAYTLTLKEKGAEAAEKELKKQLKNQAKKHKKGL